MTLLEILVAVSVSILILLASVSVYLAITGSIQRQQTSRHEPLYAALEQVRHDLVQCAQIFSTNLPAFVLTSPEIGTNSSGIASLAFSMGNLASPEVDFSSMEVIRVRYQVTPSEAGHDDGGTLSRATMIPGDANAFEHAISNAILDHVTAFDVAVLSGTDWTNQWSSSSRNLLPRAVRLRLECRLDTTTGTASMEVFIPAGNSVPGNKLNK
ncbi:MAG: type II secretion system protein GspJ [bacterium]